jgi:hypothetical protein
MKRKPISQLKRIFHRKTDLVVTSNESWFVQGVKAANVAVWYWDLASSSIEITRNEEYNKIFGIDEFTYWTRDDWIKSVFQEDRIQVKKKLMMSFRVKAKNIVLNIGL